jgi:hypothetical protein
MKLNILFCVERRRRLARPSQTFFLDLRQVRQVSRGQQNALRCRARLRKRIPCPTWRGHTMYYEYERI